MLIIPAIDIMEGRVVRLFQGKKEQKTVYSEDPVSVARRWQEEGASWIHVVDLDGALTGRYLNQDLIAKVVGAVQIPVEISGGIRSNEVLEWAMASGAQRVVLGTKAYQDRDFLQEALRRYPQGIAVALDMRQSQVVSHGWTRSTLFKASDLAREMEEMGVKTLVCTDILKDGTLEGPNLEVMEEIMAVVDVEVIASGGVSTLSDIIALKRLAPRPPAGVIVGKALYEEKFNLKEAIKVAEAKR
jgi:phosphoribosylformimino-5-aminoimidazole carboxamide ribotide isomerase